MEKEGLASNSMFPVTLITPKIFKHKINKLSKMQKKKKRFTFKWKIETFSDFPHNLKVFRNWKDDVPIVSLLSFQSKFSQ